MGKDRVIQRPVHLGSMSELALRTVIKGLRDRIFTPIPGETQEDVDPGQGATDRGSGLAYPSPMDEELGTELILTLSPEVLAQLQRIEDMLKKVCVILEPTPYVVRKENVNHDPGPQDGG